MPRANRPADRARRSERSGGRLRAVALTWTATQPARGRILLLHGVMSSVGTWHRIGAELASRGWDCLAVDLPGHGSAPRVRGSLDLDTLVGDVLTQLAAPADIVIGHSLGGIVALALAGRVCDGVRALVLEDPPGLRGVDTDALRAQIAVDAATARADLDALRRRERAANPRWSDADVEQSVAGVADAQADAVVDALAGPLRWNLYAMISAERRPLLVLAGREVQGMFPFANGGSALNGRDRADVRRLLSDDRFVEIDGRHCLHRDAPDRWLAAVAKFIEPIGRDDRSALPARRL